MTLKKCIKDFRALANNEKAEHYLRFFKTAPGEYGHGDQFLGIRVPVIREFAKRFSHLRLMDIDHLVESKWHEERMLGLIIVVNQYEKYQRVSSKEATKLYKYYISKFEFINNWDLVDVTCYKIIGAELSHKSRTVLHTWSRSRVLWVKRISMMSTFYFIKRNDFDDALKIAETLIHDQHDLIHKVVGWMLREIGKRDKSVEDKFLKQHYQSMPRTMLRYAIEKYPENERQRILKGSY